MLTPEQQRQIESQVEAYEKHRGTGIVNVPLGKEQLALQVDEFVAHPEIMNSGVQVMQYLVEHPELVKDKNVTDMGTGCGIIGLAAAQLGARHVLMSDIDPHAVTNARKNVEKLGKDEICDVFQSDLFAEYEGRPKADFQIFNHPFFADEPMKGREWTRMMLGGIDLIGRYFTDAPRYSSNDAMYLLPWLTLAENEGDAPDNDPGKRAPQFGYEIVRVTEQVPVKQGLQQALFKFYLLRRPPSRR
ncbi:MAG: methyltransferase [Candidatus Peribacteraceae bacterium]|nr:methyltransferase [Candidatus Peribacteraceae bacterium]